MEGNATVIVNNEENKSLFPFWNKRDDTAVADSDLPLIQTPDALLEDGRFDSERSTIAIITDSATNVPLPIQKRYGMYCAPLMVNYSDGQYRDGVDVTAEDIYRRFAEEIPKTSTPSPVDVTHCVEQAIADGYSKIICAPISSGLSATYDLMRSVLAGHPEVESAVIDTKNIGIGSGVNTMYAAELAAQGMPMDIIAEEVERAVTHTSVFFIVDTLEYLYKGGRINKAVYQLGTMLNLKPIITCDDEGKYVVAAKARGRAQSLKKTLALAHKLTQGAKRYRIALATGSATDADEFFARIPAEFPDAESITEYGQISPALAVHTGPGLIGFIVQVLD